MSRVIRSEEVYTAFRPIKPLLDDVIDEARKGSSYAVVASANPDVGREAHIHRLQGTKRWILVADGIVARRAAMPVGYGVASTESDHNSGKYVFSFPGGVFTVKREPHEPDEGAYLQERLEQILEEAPLAEGINPHADLKVFLSVSASGSARLIVAHESLSDPMVLLLDDIREPPLVVAPQPERRVRVRSTVERQTDVVSEVRE